MATYFLSAFIPCLIPLRYQRRTGDVGMGFECESRFQEFPFLQSLTISDFMSQLGCPVSHPGGRDTPAKGHGWISTS